MKLKTILFFAIASLALTPSIAQETETNDNSLKSQFIDAIEKSNRYQEFKVVKIVKLNKLRQNVFDSIVLMETKLDAANGTIASQGTRIEGLTETVAKLQSDLNVSKEKEDGISLFGALTKKSTYNAIMMSIIGALLVALAFFIVKFKGSNAITKEANSKLAETESEFEEHRQKNLEQQQVLRRKLQDEINKNKKSV